MIRSMMAWAAGAALVAAGPTQAQGMACVTPDEMEGLVTYFVPQVIDNVIETCSAHLPADSYVRAGLPARAEELRGMSDAAWPAARSAFMKIGSGQSGDEAEEMADMSDEMLRPMLDIFLVEAMGLKLTAGSCGEVNDITEALAPLTGAQAAHLLAVTLSAAARGDKNMASCPRGQAGQG